MRGAERVHRPRARGEPVGERGVALTERRATKRECGRVLPRRRRETGGAVLVLEQSLRFSGARVDRTLASPPPPVVCRIVDRQVPEGVIAIVAQLVQE